MTEQDRKRAEEVCSICGDGESQTWECPECGREIHESYMAARSAALAQARREGVEAMRDLSIADWGAGTVYSRETARTWLTGLADRLLSESPAPDLPSPAPGVAPDHLTGEDRQPGDRYREIREAYVAGAGDAWMKRINKQGEAITEALRRWPEPTGEVKHE